MDYHVIDWPGPEVTRFNTVICKGCGALVNDFYRAQHDAQPHALPVEEVTVSDVAGTDAAPEDAPKARSTREK